MELFNDTLLFVDPALIGCYMPYSHNELQILYHFLKKYQLTGKNVVTLDYDQIRGFFSYEDDFFYDFICRFVAAAPTKPFFIGAFGERKIINVVEYGVVDRKNKIVSLCLSGDILGYIISPDEPGAVINLELLMKFNKKKDRFCNCIGLYNILSYDYHRFSGSKALFIPFSLEELFFAGSVFDFNTPDFRKKYLENINIRELAALVDDDIGYVSKRYTWHVFYRIYVMDFINMVNSLSDIYIEGIKPITCHRETTGVIFKIRRNNKYDGYLGYTRKLKEIPSDVVSKNLSMAEKIYIYKSK